MLTGPRTLSYLPRERRTRRLLRLIGSFPRAPVGTAWTRARDITSWQMRFAQWQRNTTNLRIRSNLLCGLRMVVRDIDFTLRHAWRNIEHTWLDQGDRAIVSVLWRAGAIL